MDTFNIHMKSGKTIRLSCENIKIISSADGTLTSLKGSNCDPILVYIKLSEVEAIVEI